MAFVHNETSGDAQNGALRSMYLASHRPDPAPGDERGLEGEPSTIEIVFEPTEARDGVTVAVTMDPELRSTLAEVLPEGGLLFADSPEQVLARPVPAHCAVLIVEQSISRAAFEQLKAHLKASAPAPVNIMIGTQQDGSSLVGLLSAGSIDRFMVKPLSPGPIRSALRSALQQHQSLRRRMQVAGAESSEPLTPAPAEKVSKAAVTVLRVTPAKAKRGDRPKKAASPDVQRASHAAQVIPSPPKVSPSAPQVSPPEFKTAKEHAVSPLPHDFMRSAAAEWQAPPRSWNSAFAAITAVATLIAVGLIAWGIASRAPEVDPNQAIVDKMIADHLTAAQRAFELGSYIEPPGLSAAHFYNAALELDPTSDPARRGLQAIADQLIDDGKRLIAAGDLLRAQSTLDSVRRLQSNHSELNAVTTSLLKAREAERQMLQSAQASRSKVIESPKVELSKNELPKPVVAVSTAPPVIAKVPAGDRKSVSTSRQAQPVTASREMVPAIPSPRDNTPALKIPNAEGPAASVNRADVTRPVEASPESVRRETALSAIAKAPLVTESRTESTQPSVTSISTGAPVGPTTNRASGETKLLKYVPPVYPPRARNRGTEGWVDVNFVITREGKVIEPRIGASTLGDPFHRAAIAAVTQWQFTAAPEDVTAARPMHVRLDFRLKD